MSLHHNPRIVTSGLVFALDAGDRNSYPGSGASATDLTGTSTGVSLANSVGYTTTGIGAFNFDGTNDYISITYSSQPATSQITITAWVYPTEDATTGGRTRGAFWGGPGAMYFGLWPNGSAGSSAIHTAVQTTSGRPSTQTGTIYTNQWSYAVATYNGTNFTTYLNTEYVTQTSQTGTISSGTTYYVGTYSALTDANHNFPGYIAHASMYSRALTFEEIQQNYEAQKSRFGL